MKLLVLVGIMFVTAGIAAGDVNISEDDFEKEFGVEKSPDPAEEGKRAEELAKEEEEINANNDDPNSTETEALNDMSNLPEDEFLHDHTGMLHESDEDKDDESRAMGIILPPLENQWDAQSEAYFDRFRAMSSRDLPDEYDSEALGLVTAVKNQKSCGSCAAFSSTSVLETCMLVATKQTVEDNNLNLAEQALMDCGRDGQGCNGAWPHKYFKYLRNVKGGELPAEESNPYTATNGVCPTDYTPQDNGAVATDFMWTYASSEDLLKRMIVEHGSASVCIDVGNSATRNYASGVVTACDTTSCPHAVVAVGYGTENGIDYWKIKNSWGSRWGDGGYIKISRGANHCAVQRYLAIAICSDKNAPAAAKPRRCYGYYSPKGCCTADKPCGLDDGDCDRDSECEGDLVCGRNNCKDALYPNEPAGFGYKVGFDCCTKA